MAIDTSMLTPDVHRRLREGESIEAIAAAFQATPAAVKQYLGKVDEDGRTRQAEPTT